MAHNQGRTNQQNRPVPVPAPQPPPLDSAAIQTLLDNQRLEAQNEAQKIRLREKEIDVNAEFAKESLRLQAAYINKKAGEDRKTLVTVAVIAAVFLSGLIAFVIYCLSVGERDFIYKILQGLGYLVTSGLGYYFGLKGGKKSKSDPNAVQDAEVVNE